MMVTCHSNRLISSTRPAEKPSTGRFVSSAQRTTRVRRALWQLQGPDAAPYSSQDLAERVCSAGNPTAAPFSCLRRSSEA